MTRTLELMLDAVEAGFQAVQKESILLAETETNSQAGDSAEVVVVRQLKNWLPDYIKVSSGLIAYVNEGKFNVTRECDAILIDTRVVHKLFTFGTVGLQVVPKECVLGVIEIKKSLNKKSLKSALDQIGSRLETAGLRKDPSKKILPHGIGLPDELEGKHSWQPMTAIISLSHVSESSKEFDNLVVGSKLYQDGLGPDLIVSFDGFAMATSNSPNKIGATLPFNWESDRPHYTVLHGSGHTALAYAQGLMNAYCSKVCGIEADLVAYLNKFIVESGADWRKVMRSLQTDYS